MRDVVSDRNTGANSGNGFGGHRFDEKRGQCCGSGRENHAV
jgi:hypothetical protein